MSLCFVTGLSGTGKSAVLRELRVRGCLTRGVDEDGYADWVSRRTGLAEVIPRDDLEFDIHAWYRAHDWVLNARRVSVLSRAAARCGRPVFLCGSALGEADVWHLFDRVVALVADVSTIKRRLAARAGDYGKAPEELVEIIGWHAGFEESYRRFGAVMVDATRPLHEVTDEVLSAVRLPSGEVQQCPGQIVMHLAAQSLVPSAVPCLQRERPGRPLDGDPVLGGELVNRPLPANRHGGEVRIGRGG